VKDIVGNFVGFGYLEELSPDGGDLCRPGIGEPYVVAFLAAVMVLIQSYSPSRFSSLS